MTVTDKTTKKSPLNFHNYPLLVVEVEGSVCNRALRYVYCTVGKTGNSDGHSNPAPRNWL